MWEPKRAVPPLGPSIERRPIRNYKWVAGISCAAAAFAIGIGLLVVWLEDTTHEWPWYLVIIGTGLLFIAALALPRPIDTGPLLTVTAALVLWIYGAGIFVDLVDSNDTFGRAPLAIGVFGVVVITFFGVLFLPREASQGGLSDAAMRHAFGAAFLLGYFALAYVAIFHDKFEVPPLGQQLADEATTLLGIVVAFYFTSSATVEYLKHRESQKTIRAGQDPDPSQPPPLPPK